MWQTSDFADDRLPETLDGVAATINGKTASVYFISPQQVNVQVPSDAAVGPVEVVLKNRYGAATGTVLLQAYAPALFPLLGKYAAAVHTDGVLVAPPGSISDLNTRSARPGETIQIYGTGFGPTLPAVAAGQVFNGSAPLADPTLLEVRIGGLPVTVQYAGLVGPGEYQFNVVVPLLSDGNYPIVAEIAGLPSQASLSIPIKN